MLCNDVKGLTRYVLCKENVYQKRLLQVKNRIEAIVEKRSRFDGRLVVEKSMAGQDLPSTLFYSRRKNMPEILGRELLLRRDHHYADSGHVWVHSFVILFQISKSDFTHVLKRIERASKREPMVSLLEFENLVACLLTQPKEYHGRYPAFELK